MQTEKAAISRPPPPRPTQKHDACSRGSGQTSSEDGPKSLQRSSCITLPRLLTLSNTVRHWLAGGSSQWSPQPYPGVAVPELGFRPRTMTTVETLRANRLQIT
jgi:hypothetical protein